MQNTRYYQKCITFGRAAEGLRADFQKQLLQLQREIGFSYVRFHGIFHDDMAVYRENEAGEPVFWFGYVDSLMDFLLSAGLKPILELGFMPKALARVPDTVFWWHANGSPPKSEQKWCRLVEATLRHFCERYGKEEVCNWYFEVWNEPNLDAFWRGTQAEYFRLYQVTARTVKGVDPRFRVGGPSVSGADFRDDLRYLDAFIAFCAKEKLPVDFFSGHPYPTYWPLDTGGNEKMGYLPKSTCQKFIRNMREKINQSPFSGAELHLTEWNSSPSPRDLVHDMPFEAPFILYNITQNFGVTDSLAYWAFTDIFEENGPGEYPFHGGFGLITMDGVKKPSYWAYRFLSLLGDEILEIAEDHILTKQKESYQLLMWNYCDYTEAFAKGDRSCLSLLDRDGAFDAKPACVRANVPLKGKYRQTVYTLDKSTSAFHNWVRMGAPQYPKREQVESLKRTSRPKCQKGETTDFAGAVTLAPHEVRLYFFEKEG